MAQRIPSVILLNLTAHNIVVYPADGSNLILYPRGEVVAKLKTRKQKYMTSLADGSPVFEPQKFVAISPRSPTLQPYHQGVIVSLPVAQWLAEKKFADWGAVYTADTGPQGAVYGEDGTIIGTRRLNRYL